MAYEKNKIFMTDTDMLRDGVTPYKIVLPKKCTPTEKRAADELKFFFKKATGIALAETADNIKFDASLYYFSIGKTALAEQAGILCPDDGFSDVMRLKSVGNVIFFFGSGEGVVFAVYEFLKIMFSYRYYALDEYKLDKKTMLKVPVIDINYVPSFPRRSLGYYDTERDMEYVYRLKLGNTLYSGWVECCHTYFKILPKEKYFAAHPDWYSPDGKNLCLSSAEMRIEFVEQVKKSIEKNDGNLFMLGQEDTYDFCTCENCKKKIASSGTAAALVMEFTNYVAQEVGEWLEAVHPERKMTFVAFAYNETFAPPVTFDKYTQSYKPVSDSVVARDNVAVMVVPYNAVYSTDYFDEKHNAYVKEGLLGWKAVANNIMIWSYCTVYGNYIIPFNNWDAVGECYKILSGLGTTFIYDAASFDTRVPSFEEMRQFVQAELMWNADASVPALTDEFLDAYYREAAPVMKYVLELQKSRWYYIEGVYKKYLYSFDSFNELVDKKFWSESFISSMDEAFEKAFELAANGNDKKLVSERIAKEYIFVRYLKTVLYPEKVADPEKEKKALAAECKKFGINFLYPDAK